MILERMSLRNFKRFQDADIDFLHGITGIVGMNGTGKSSIVDAIFFALYGVSGGLASDHIVSAFADGEKCEVTLDFTVGSESFRIQRTFRKGKTVQHDATLLCNESIRASGVSQVEAEVRRILGMGPVDFRNTIYAAQKDLMTLLDLTPGKRKEWFLRALGIDYLNTGSQKILKEQCDAKEKEATLLQGELTALSRQDPAELEQVRLSITGLKDKFIALRAEERDQQFIRNNLSAELQAHELRTVQFSKQEDQEKSLRNEVAVLMARAVTLAEQESSLTVDDQELQQLEETVNEIPKAREEIEQHRTRKSQVEANAAERRGMPAEIRALDNKSAALKIELHALDDSEIELARLYVTVRTALDIPKDVADVDNAVTEFSAYVAGKITNLTTRIRANDEACDKIKATLETIRNTGPGGTCPICLQQLGEHFGDVEREYVARLAEMMVEGDDLNKELEKALDETHRVPNLKPTLDRIMHIHKGLGYREFHEKELSATLSRLTEITTRHNELGVQQEKIGYDDEAHLLCKQRLVELEKAQNRLNALTRQSAQQAGIKAQIAEVNSQITSKSAALAEVKGAIDANPIDLSAGPRLTHEVEKIDLALKTITQDLATSIERERALTQKIKDLELAAARIGVVEQQLTALRDEIEILKLTRAAIADYVVYIMQVVRSRIESEVSSIISEITGGKYDQVLIDEDFNLLVRENDREYTVDRFSGGEQDDIAVALRIALSRYLAELHQVHESTLLIFDEIFGSQDEERRANLLTALRSQESRFPQIILISHIAEIQGEFENTLIVQGNGPVSTVRAGA